MDDFSRLLANRPETAQRIAQETLRLVRRRRPDRRRSRADARCMERDRRRDPRRPARPLSQRCLHAGAGDDARISRTRSAWTVGILRGLTVDITGEQLANADGRAGHDDLPPTKCRRLAEWPGVDQPVEPGAAASISRAASSRKVGDALRQGGRRLRRPRSRTGSAASRSRTICAANCVALGSGPDGKRAITQILLAGPGYQTR